MPTFVASKAVTDPVTFEQLLIVGNLTTVITDSDDTGFTATNGAVRVVIEGFGDPAGGPMTTITSITVFTKPALSFTEAYRFGALDLGVNDFWAAVESASVHALMDLILDGDDAMAGSGFDDEINGRDGDDEIVGGDGEDWLEGEAGDDWLKGDDEDDYTLGGDGDDLLEGGAGNDMMSGGAGRDVLKGGADYDYMDGGKGKDRIDGGAGDDGANYEDSEASVVIALDGANWVTVKVGGKDSDVIRNVEDIEGSEFADRITGDGKQNRLDGESGNDRIAGGGGQDQLYGRLGNDRLNGGAGDDIIEGEQGNDRMSGGAGADTFVFSLAADDISNVETILDFEVGTDTIELNSFVFASLEDGQLDGEHLSIGGPYETDDYLIYMPGSGKLFYDADGVGNNESAVLVAKLSKNLDLTASDIFIS
jgi:Ca2+-binding RTX toxin-like protein